MVDSEKDTTVIDKVNALIDQKYFGLARERLTRSLEANPNSSALRVKLVEVYYQLRDFHQAGMVLDTLLKESPDNDQLFSLLPQILLNRGHTEQAIERSKELIERIGDNSPHATAQLAEIYEKTSSTEELRQLIDEIKTTDELSTMIKLLGEGRLALRGKEYDQAIDYFLQLKGLLESTKSTDETLRVNRIIDCFFQMAKAYDRMGDFDNAWSAASQAHKTQREISPKFNAAQYTNLLDAVSRRMDPETVKSLAHCDTTLEKTPLYIVGNPRSGTSLLEQILSMHPEVENGGELSIGLRLQEDLLTVTDSYHGWPGQP